MNIAYCLRITGNLEESALNLNGNVNSGAININGSLESGITKAEAYNGEYTITPTKETQTLYTANKMAMNNITINPAITEWGDIEGTLTSQTDLKNALDGKADTSDIPSALTTTDIDEAIA